MCVCGCESMNTLDSRSQFHIMCWHLICTSSQTSFLRVINVTLATRFLCHNKPVDAYFVVIYDIARCDILTARFLCCNNCSVAIYDIILASYSILSELPNV